MKWEFSPLSTDWGTVGSWTMPGNGPKISSILTALLKHPEEIYMVISDRDSKKRGYLQEIVRITFPQRGPEPQGKGDSWSSKYVLCIYRIFKKDLKI